MGVMDKASELKKKANHNQIDDHEMNELNKLRHKHKYEQGDQG